MRRGVKDSDEEVDMKSGRKTRIQTEAISVDSPRRRSSRIKPNIKQNESSPESSLSDASNISNIQTGKSKKQRTSIMDSSTPTENQRTLRSRMNSISSDISEIPETDIGSPTKKTRNNPPNSNKTNSRRSKRLTRAGSEVNSPSPAIRVTRSTRASSVEPESNVSNKLLEKYQNEFVSSPIKTRRRISVLPSEAMVIEEKGQCMKIPMVTLDRTLPDLNEVKEPGSDNSPKTAQKNEKQHKLDTSRKNVNEKHAEENVSVKGPHDNTPENLPSNSFEEVEKGTSTDDKKISDNKDVLESIETSSTDIIKQVESSVDNDSQIPSQNENQNTSEEVELKLEDSNELVEKESRSNEENLTTDIDIDSQQTKNAISDTLEGPKHLSISSSNANESTEEKDKSLRIETNGTLKRRSEELLGMPSDNISIEVNSDTNVVYNLSVENLDTSIHEDNSDNMQKLVMSTETDSVNDNSFEENLDKGGIIDVSTNSSLNESIEMMEHTEDGKKLDNNKSTEIDIEMNEESSKINIKECNENMNSKLNDSNAKESINENEEPEKDNKDENTITSDQCDKKDKSDEPSTSENMHKNDDTNCTKMLSPKLSNIESKSRNMKLIQDTQHSIVSEHEDISYLQDINKTDNLACNPISPSKSLDTCISHEDSALTNMNEANVTNVIKNHNSSIVTETPAEFVKREPERGEQSKKVSVLGDSSTLKKQCAHSLESNEKQSDIKQTASKKCQEHIEVDENDSDTSMTNLFQDIPATEWKEKNSEKLENESEGECDLVLVDKESWLTVENLKKEKEKETFDYDSDDTVLLKVQRDSMKTQNDEDLSMDVSGDECNLNESKDKSSSTNEQKTIKQNKNRDKREMIEGSKDTVQNIEMSTNVDENKSVTKRNNRHSISKSNMLIQKSIEAKDLSESCEGIETEENSSLNKNKLSKNGPKRRKSLNKSIQEIDNKQEEPNVTEIIKKRKSLNKSNSKDTEKSQSLNNSLKKKVKLQQLDVNFARESDNESNEFESCEKEDTITKKKWNRNYSTVANIGSDSNESKSISDSDDSQNKFMELPKFLFDGASDSNSDDDNESNNTIDSDIQKEYNLHGEDISKFSDDDVPGDECRASETESSDPYDNGSDLADFVVDDDEVEEELEEFNESGGEEGEEMENDELVKEDTKEDQRDDEKQMQSEIEIEQETNQKEEQYENKENTNEKDINKVTDTSIKEKNKSKSANISSSHIIGSDKKKNKKLKTDHTEVSEKENNFTNLSFSSPLEIKKTKQKRASGEFIVEGVEESMNESQLVFNKKMQKFNKSMECSTPKINLSKQDKFNVAIRDRKSDCLNDEEKKNMTLQEEQNLSKLSNIKCNESLIHRSLPSELIDLLTKTNLSKPMSAKVSELNKTTLTLGSETPTTKYLKKEKLNESAPILKLDTNSKKSTYINNNNDQIQSNEDDNEQKTEVLQNVNDSLKRKLFKVADNILENDRQKKRKKQKQSTVKETTSSILPENNDSEIVEQIKHVNFNVNTDNNDEKVDKKKRKKKKMKTGEADIQMQKKTIKIESESRDKIKKKKKEEKLIKDIPVVENINEKKVTKKKKKVSDFLPNDNISNEQIPKKKRKLLIKDTALQDNEALSEQIPIVAKKKKKTLSNDILQNEEVLVKKVPKKKRKLSKDITHQGENISVEKSSKKKKKLLVGVEKDNVKHTTLYNELQEFNDPLSDSDEGPETVAFSKAREEALEVLKRTADSIKANKDMRKKKQKEHIEKMQKQKEIKAKKLKSNNQITESNKVDKQEKSVKRLPDDVLQNLSDAPLKSLKKKKSSEMKEQVLPSSMSGPKKIKNIFVEDDFTPPSCAGSTTEFSVVDIQKIKKKQKVSKVTSFRQKMLNRNSRQPMSAYLMYLEKQRALGKDKFCNKPY
ncbi:PREDICTED: uncharacterized protein PFB0145c-like [Eufriesea mexicana]|uniref:uncharacterized protein PFB0145c-like n=1 Tax=Eufriesea mexicana TaxID=516756 RepID=UPI00083BAFD2|nr:PREDICTED: uncharacterized protein PFB0145c-like [Eufriesea mexicana]